MHAGKGLARGVIVSLRLCAVVGLGLAAGLGVVGSAWASASEAAAAVDVLPNDPRVVMGELDNGMKYVVRKHGNPAGRVSVWMHVSSGSLNETDAQRGIAHYLEHMAFNGSENFPPGSVVPFFESLGLTFGQHQNAFTSFDQTVYQLALPDNKPETLDKALNFMGDVSRKLSLLPKEIDNERQIILEERRSGFGAQQRIRDIVFKRIAPGSTVGERIPIGMEETITAVKQPDFQEYYGTWYTPSNMTVIVVGDIDEKAVVEQIRAKMSGGGKKPVPEDRPVGVKAAEKPSAVVVQDKELTRAGIAMLRVTPARAPAVTGADVRRDVVELVTSQAFNRRLEEKINAGKVAFQSAGGGINSVFRAMVLSQGQAGGEPEKWKEVLTDFAAEMQRARKFGFTEDELNDVKKEVMASLEARAKQEDTYNAVSILGRINSQIGEGEPIRSAAQDLELVKEMLPTITASELNETFVKAFDPSGFVYVLELPESVKAPSEEELLKLATDAINADVKAETKGARAEKLLEKAPSGGSVSEQSEHAESAVTSAWLSNGVRVRQRFMDTEKNRISISISLLGGSMLETAENRGVTSAAVTAWQRAATEKLSSTNIRDLMTGKKVDVAGVGGQESIKLVLSGDPVDLESGLELAYLLLTEPKIESAAFTQWRTNQLQQIEANDKNPMQFFRKVLARTIYPVSEARTQPLTKENIEKVTIEQAQAWLTKLIAGSPIEVAVVGDMAREQVMPLVATYVGGIKARERISPDSYAKQREMARPKGPMNVEKTLETQTPQAVVLGGFYAPDSTNVPDVRKMDLASRIISTRMNTVIREQEALVYGIGASLQPGGTYKGFGAFLAASTTDPAKVPALVERIGQMYGEFAEKGITAEELAVAKRQAKNELDEQIKKSAYWTGVMDLMTFDQVKLEDVLAGPTAYEAISADEVVNAFKTYYKPENTFTVVVKPEAPVAPAVPEVPAKAPEGK